MNERGQKKGNTQRKMAEARTPARDLGGREQGEDEFGEGARRM